jgi:hypothetical protein
MTVEQNAVSIRVKHFDGFTGKLEGVLEVDLVTPLNTANTKVPLLLDNREILLTVPLQEFYVRQLTGRYSFPIKLDVGKLLNQRQKEPSSARSPGVGTVVRRSGRDFSKRILATEGASHQESVEVGLNTVPSDPVKRKLVYLNKTKIATIWMLGCIPITVVRQELSVVDVQETFVAVLVKVQPGSSRAMRVIIEAFDENGQLVSRMNFSEIGPFMYGKVVELSFDTASAKSISYIQSRLDVRLAKDPKCILSLSSK